MQDSYRARSFFHTLRFKWFVVLVLSRQVALWLEGSHLGTTYSRYIVDRAAWDFARCAAFLPCLTLGFVWFMGWGAFLVTAHKRWVRWVGWLYESFWAFWLTWGWVEFSYRICAAASEMRIGAGRLTGCTIREDASPFLIASICPLVFVAMYRSEIAIHWPRFKYETWCLWQDGWFFIADRFGRVRR